MSLVELAYSRDLAQIAPNVSTIITAAPFKLQMRCMPHHQPEYSFPIYNATSYYYILICWLSSDAHIVFRV